MSYLDNLKGRLLTQLGNVSADCRCGNFSPSDVREAIDAVFTEAESLTVTPSKTVTPSEPHVVISPWAHEQAVREMACLRCKALPGEKCRTPAARLRSPHLERTRRYRQHIGAYEFNLRHQREAKV